MLNYLLQRCTMWMHHVVISVSDHFIALWIRARNWSKDLGHSLLILELTIRSLRRTCKAGAIDVRVDVAIKNASNCSISVIQQMPEIHIVLFSFPSIVHWLVSISRYHAVISEVLRDIPSDNLVDIRIIEAVVTKGDQQAATMISRED